MCFLSNFNVLSLFVANSLVAAIWMWALLCLTCSCSPTLLALSLCGKAEVRFLCQNPRTPEIPVLALPSHVFWVDSRSSCRPSCQVTHRAQIPDPSCVGCAGVCAHSYQNQFLSSLAQAAMPNGGIQSPEISSSGTSGVAGGSCIISE